MAQYTKGIFDLSAGPGMAIPDPRAAEAAQQAMLELQQLQQRQQAFDAILQRQFQNRELAQRGSLGAAQIGLQAQGQAESARQFNVGVGENAKQRALANSQAMQDRIDSRWRDSRQANLQREGWGRQEAADERRMGAQQSQNAIENYLRARGLTNQERAQEDEQLLGRRRMSQQQGQWEAEQRGAEDRSKQEWAKLRMAERGQSAEQGRVAAEDKQRMSAVAVAFAQQYAPEALEAVLGRQPPTPAMLSRISAAAEANLFGAPEALKILLSQGQPRAESTLLNWLGVTDQETWKPPVMKSANLQAAPGERTYRLGEVGGGGEIDALVNALRERGVPGPGPSPVGWTIGPRGQAGGMERMTDRPFDQVLSAGDPGRHPITYPFGEVLQAGRAPAPEVYEGRGNSREGVETGGPVGGVKWGPRRDWPEGPQYSGQPTGERMVFGGQAAPAPAPAAMFQPAGVDAGQWNGPVPSTVPAGWSDWDQGRLNAFADLILGGKTDFPSVSYKDPARSAFSPYLLTEPKAERSKKKPPLDAITGLAPRKSRRDAEGRAWDAAWESSPLAISKRRMKDPAEALMEMVRQILEQPR